MDYFKNKNTGLLTRKDLRSPKYLILYIVLALLSIGMVLISILPPLWILLSSFKDIKELFRVPPTFIPETFHPEKITKAWEKMHFARYYLNSFILVTGAIACAVVFNGLLAFVLAKLKPKGHKIVFALVLWSLMIPSTTALVPLFQNIANLGLINSFVPLWFGYGAMAFNVLLFKSFFEDLPTSYIEAARMDGASDITIFMRIVLPLSVSIMIVISIFTFTGAWSDFLMPYLVLKSDDLATVMIKLYRMNEIWGFSMDLRLVAIIFSIIPPVILFIIFQRQITEGMTLSGVKG